MAAHRHFPSNLMERETVFQEDWDKLTKSRCEKPGWERDLQLRSSWETAAKGGSTQN